MAGDNGFNDKSAIQRFILFSINATKKKSSKPEVKGIVSNTPKKRKRNDKIHSTLNSPSSSSPIVPENRHPQLHNDASDKRPP